MILNKLHLLAFRGYRNKADDGDDLDGDVIESEDAEEKARARGDFFDPTADKPEDKAPEKEEPKVEEPVVEEEKPEVKAPAHIPKQRFDEVLAQRNAERERVAEMELRIKALEAAKAPAVQEQPADINALETEYANLMLEGDVEKAVKLRGQINAVIRAEAEAAADQRLEQREQARTQKSIEAELQRESTAVIRDYPYLDTEDGADVLDMIVAKRNSYIANGIAPAEALRKAADLIAPKFAPEGEEKPEPKTEVKPDTRKQAAIQRGIKDSELQPPNMTGVGNRAMETIKKDVSKMTDEEFDALPKDVKSKLRGD